MLGEDVSFIRNHSVIDSLPLMKFINQISNFTVNEILSRDSFQNRIKLGNSICLHELIVPILQAWDSIFIGAQVEIGGNDQLFNFKLTRELQICNKQNPQVCILTPIINGLTVEKMSKSLGNCIFLMIII
ncbi:MAG: hypothetical protein HC836_50425 [Richelia sp. RM2_1_2]|nr:hypothetical protein [Richelia sp. RM2_1_2]